MIYLFIQRDSRQDATVAVELYSGNSMDVIHTVLYNRSLHYPCRLNNIFLMHPNSNAFHFQEARIIK